MLMASDLTTAQSFDGRFSMIFSLGVSRSSMAGDKSFGVNGMIWSTLDQFAVSSSYTNLKFSEGKLNSVHSYGATVANLKGTWMLLTTYTYVKPDPKIGTYGINVGSISLLNNSADGGKEVSVATSVVGFWTKPFQYGRKVTLSPQVFVMSSPISYMPSTSVTTINRHFGFLLGSSFDYKISKRFGFSFNYKVNVNTAPGSPILHNFLIGSRMML